MQEIIIPALNIRHIQIFNGHGLNRLIYSNRTVSYLHMLVSLTEYIVM